MSTTSNTTNTAPDPNDWNGHSVVANAAVSLTLATLAVALRLWARFGILRVVGLEDWLLLAALFFSVGVTVCIGLQLQHGLGRHVMYISSYDYMMYFKLSIIVTIAYVLSMTLTKLSILCLYIRVLTYNRVRLAAKMLLGLVLVSHVYILATLATACIPLDAFWDFSKRDRAYCHPLSIYWSHAGLNIVTDFLILLLPLVIVYRIRSPRPQKIALCVIFVLGFSVCIISLTRAGLLARDIDHSIGDVTWDSATAATWNSWEINIAILCACLTTMKPIVNRFFPHILSGYPSTLADEDSRDAYGQGQGPGSPGHEARAMYMASMQRGEGTRLSRNTNGDVENPPSPADRSGHTLSHLNTRKMRLPEEI